MPLNEHTIEPPTSSALVRSLVQELRETSERKFIERAGIRKALEQYTAAFGLTNAADLPSITGPRGSRSPQRQKMVLREGMSYRDYILNTYDFMYRWREGKPPRRPLPPEYRMAQELLMWIGITPTPTPPPSSHDSSRNTRAS